ncbi:MAG: branched-chain amino acid ABC transporter permease [Planctomycetes bacterium]|nr:branched-chain amino acid ABC transporter permease [Planctomycetota bacterium]
MKQLLRNDWAWLGLFVLLFMVLGPLPPAFGLGAIAGDFGVQVLLTIMIYMIFGLGLNIVIGYTGLLDLGYASFMAMGAIVVAAGLVLTQQPAGETLQAPLGDLRLTQEQRELEANANAGPVVVQYRPDWGYDVVSGAEAVLAALEAQEAAGPDAEPKTLSVQPYAGLVLPVGQKSAKGTHPFGSTGGFLLLLAIAGVVCAAFGVLRGIPTLRLTGDYYAIVTLGIAEIVYITIQNEGWLTGGAYGIKLDGETIPHLFGADPNVAQGGTWWFNFYYVVLVALVFAFVFSKRLELSRLGRSWAAIKADEVAAMASGIDVKKAKLLAFLASGFLGGVGGGLYALKLTTVTHAQAEVFESIIVVCFLVFGGMGTIRGALLGAAMLQGLAEFLRLLSDPFWVRDHVFFLAADSELSIPNEARMLIYGLMLVLLMRFRPQGLLPPRAGGDPPSKQQQATWRLAETPLFRVGGKT